MVAPVSAISGLSFCVEVKMDLEKLVSAVESLTGAITEVRDDVGKLNTRMEGVEKLGAEVEEVKKGLRPIHVDDNGQPVGAPAIVKGLGQSKPLYLMNVIKAIQQKDWSLAIEEKNIGDRLEKAGYMKGSQGGIMFPLAPELIPDDHSELREEISKRMSLSVDHGELAYLCKRFPSVARLFEVQKDLAIGTDTLGGYLVPAVQSDRIIDLLRNREVFMRAGAREVPLPPSGQTPWPKLSTDPTFTWGDPDRTSNISTSNLGFDMLRLRAKQLVGAIAIPNALIRFSTPSVELVARAALATGAAIAEDLAWLEGAGTDLEPKGITNYPFSANDVPARGKVSLHVATTTGANGNTFEPEDIALMLARYEEGKDPEQPTAWVMRPVMWAVIQNRRGDAVSANDKKGPFMFPVSRGDAGRAPEKRLQDIPVITTLQANADRVKGSGTNLQYIMLGNFTRWMIGRSGALELAASEHVRFLQDQTVLKAILYADAGPEHEESFVLTDTLLGS